MPSGFGPWFAAADDPPRLANEREKMVYGCYPMPV